jgi:hypothetical protein
MVKNMRKKFSLGSSNEVTIYSCVRTCGFTTFQRSLFYSFYYLKQESHLYGLSKLLNFTFYPSLTQFSFGAALIFELRQDIKGLYYVQILAKNNSMNQPISLRTLHMDHCEDQLCPLGNFFDMTGSMLVTNFESECSWDLDSDDGNGTTNSTNGTITNDFMLENCTDYTNTTSSRFAQGPSLSKLEIALIVVSATLTLFSFFLLALLGLNFHRNRVRKTVF